MIPFNEAGLILGQISHCMERNSSDMPGVCPGKRECGWGSFGIDWYTKKIDLGLNYKLLLLRPKITFWNLSLNWICRSVILLQIVMVRPGTRLAKNHESLSRTNESQLKKKESKIENAWAFMQLDNNLKTDSKTLYYSVMKWNYSPSILKHNKG